MQRPLRKLLHRLLGHLEHVDAIAVDVEPGAVEEENDVLGEVEGGGDEGEAEEEEDDGPCFVEDRVSKSRIEESSSCHWCQCFVPLFAYKPGKQKRERDQEGRSRTEYESLDWREHIHAVGDLDLVLL